MLKMDNKIIEKIKKLLALANSPNENEAKLASSKAQELLIEHNISMATIKKEENEFKSEDIIKKRQPVENKFIYAILKEHFFVSVIFHSTKIEMIGREDNLEVAKYVQSFLSNAFKSIYKQTAKEKGWKNGSNRNAFYFGLFKGLDKQLTEQKEKMKQNENIGNALLVIDKALQNYVNNKYPNLSQRGQRVRGNSEAIQEGIRQGERLKIARGIESKNDNNKVMYLG